MSNGTLVSQQFVDVQQLIPHPRNNEFYGDPREASDFDAFVEFVRNNGIHPLIVADDMEIIGGHRRYYAALAIGIPFVHATVYHYESEIDKLAALIADNNVRVKNNWQVAQEAQALYEIETERDKLNEANSNEPSDNRSNGHSEVLRKPSSNGRALEQVAMQLDRSSKTIEDMLTVKKAVDDLEQKGEHEKTEELIALVNRSVEKAAKQARKYKRADIPISPDKKWFSVVEWESFSESQRDALLTSAGGEGKFNKQTSDSIEWAKWSWNPITGCKHNCPYCYARDIAQDKYVNLPILERFDPFFYPDRLAMPANTKLPDLSIIENEVERIGLRNVFTCSMADLFGKWVPTGWIEAVLDQVADNPQWNFLFLTKFPIRMAEFEYPPNTWIGTTVDKQPAVERAEKAFRKIRAGGYAGVAWLSCEPMMEQLTFSSLEMFDWVVMGGASRSSETPAFAPPQRWISHLVAQADACNLPIYQKTNLIQQNGVDVDFDGRIREYPI